MANLTPALTLSSPAGPSIRHGEPVVIGVPFSRQSLTDERQLRLTDDDNNEIPCDTTVLDRWPDNSARWALLAFRATTDMRRIAFNINTSGDRDSAKTEPHDSQLRVRQEKDEITIDTGCVRFILGSGAGWPIRHVYSMKSEDWLDSSSLSGLQITVGDGRLMDCSVRETDLETAGSVRAVVCCRSIARMKSRRRLEIDWRLEFFAGLPIVIVHLTIRNPHSAIHPGGYWELGDPGSILLQNAAFRLIPEVSPAGTQAWCSLEPGQPMHPINMPFEIYQDSSGGENWQSSNHVNRENRIPTVFRGYRCNDMAEGAYRRATPIVSIETSRGKTTLATRYFWQNFPKSLEVSESGILYGLFPRQWNDLHELQGGEQKTHTFAISFGLDGITEAPLDWFRQPLIPTLNPHRIAETGAIAYFIPAELDPHQHYLALVEAGIAGNDTFEHKRELVDEYGWRNFGDIYGDHEAVYAKDFHGSGPLVSHYNNQYDPIAGFCLHWLRSGDCRWWLQFNELTAHVVDIDIYHTSEDKAAYNNGLFWHTFHYVDAGKSTHRSYPHLGTSNGGGPASEHVYTTGLMMHYFITGNKASREAAITLAKFIIDIDDGFKTVFRWLARHNTGLASQSGSAIYHGPGRGSGNALNALTDGYRLTQNACFLEKAEQIIKRVVHPCQSITLLNLGNIEKRWFYTMFLQALGKYLDLKLELDSMDGPFVYGRECLLHYARWMTANEYAYLEHPEVLEYPTETWAAQDLRKAEVFNFAGKYASNEERSLFFERAEYFFKRALEMLAEHETRTLARPMVLLLSQGWTHAWFRGNPELPTRISSTRPSQFAALVPFIPQKALALRRAKKIALVCVTLALIATAAILWHLLLRLG
jgi:hypothetical protein